MHMFRSAVLAIAISCALAACSASHSPETASTASTTPPLREAPAPAAPADNGVGFDPTTACHFLSSDPMFTRGGEWTSMMDDTVDDYACGTTYFQLGEPAGGGLANNISVYGRGTLRVVKRVNLLLNVNDAGTFPNAIQAFQASAAEFYKAALKQAMNPQVKKALATSTPGSWRAGNYTVELLREDWPTGRGYSLNFVIRDPAFVKGY